MPRIKKERDFFPIQTALLYQPEITRFALKKAGIFRGLEDYEALVNFACHPLHRRGISVTVTFNFKTNDATGFFLGGRHRNAPVLMSLNSEQTGNMIDLGLDAAPSFMKCVGGNFMPISAGNRDDFVAGHDVNHPDFLQCSLRFKWDTTSRPQFESEAQATNVPGIRVVNRAGAIAGSDLDVSIATPFLPENTHITGGAVEIIFNTPATKAEIQIPPQDIHDVPVIEIGNHN
jgi:hypothetical protein